MTNHLLRIRQIDPHRRPSLLGAFITYGMDTLRNEYRACSLVLSACYRRHTEN